jgi:hypothetical protein
MPAEEIRHAQMQADRGGGGDTMSGYFAPDCPRTLMPPGTTLRGPAGITRFPRTGSGAAAWRQAARPRNASASGLTGRVSEYDAMPGRAA